MTYGVIYIVLVAKVVLYVIMCCHSSVPAIGGRFAVLCGPLVILESHGDLIDAGDIGQRRRLIETITLIEENVLNRVTAF